MPHPKAYIRPDELASLRSIPLAEALELIGIDHKADHSYKPRLHHESERWHVSDGGHVVELIVTASRWFDTRNGKGGCGAIDLLMHLRGWSFREAVARLRH